MLDSLDVLVAREVSAFAGLRYVDEGQPPLFDDRRDAGGEGCEPL
jgi:hypothetical protein